jgi:hypothetical protein
VAGATGLLAGTGKSNRGVEGVDVGAGGLAVVTEGVGNGLMEAVRFGNSTSVSIGPSPAVADGLGATGIVGFAVATLAVLRV